MICQRCLRQTRSSARIIPRIRLFSSLSARRAATEPFTTPASMSPSARGQVVEADVASAAAKAAPTVKSSVPAGTILKGLNILKDKSDPVAMEDHEYPDWLWNVLSDMKKEANADDGKAASKKKGKKSKAGKVSTQQKPVPVHHQSIDLPVSDGSDQSTVQALAASRAVTKAMRADRRAKIKESNFLKAMR